MPPMIRTMGKPKAAHSGGSSGAPKTRLLVNSITERTDET